MAKHTEGAVHLTSLSLDLTQFNENIQQIQKSTAEVADIAVQNLNKIQEALNVPVEQMRLSMDTSQIVQDMSRAQASVEGLRNAFGTVSKEIQGGQLFSSKSFDDLVEALHLTGNEASVAHDKLKTLLSSLNEYDKVSISASGGKLLQAVITSTDEAGAKIQNVIDLTKKLDDKFLEGSITISDNAEKRNAALEQQNARIEKSNNALADSLIRIISQYEKLGREINRSDLSDVVKADFLQDITTAENQIKGLQEEIRVMNQTMSNSELSSRLDPFNIQLENIAVNFGKAKQTQKEFLTDADKQISKISTQYEQLATNIEKSDLSNLVKKDLLSRIKEAQTNMQNLANDVAEVSSIAQKGDYDKEFGNISIQLKNISEDFGKAKEAQKEFLAGEKRVEDLSQDYAQLQNRLAGLVYSMTSSKIDTPEMGASIANAKNLAIEMANVANAVRNSDTITEGAKSTFNNFADAVLRLELNLKAIKTSNAEYKKSLQPVQQTVQETISSLKTLEKTAVFKTSKDQVAALRAKYEEFLQTLKNTNISVDDAEKELADLQKQFNELETTVKHGNGTLENWVNKITESAKWQIANSALNLLQQSFGQLTTTIIDTENAVIELRRVLNDKNLVDSEMTQELYDIAYEFGQTFDNVQEVAVKFAQTGKTWEETIAATRATMLGLNTAELEVSTATEGLIAVMAQFNVEADDLEEVIDKINITADNFPVTSEKIVAALQRAGGTARAFGMSLDETIGVITALSRATGRAGEAIGTAMNSLITFSMKGSALEKFSEFLGQDVSNFSVLELWQALAEEINNGNESLATMMSTSEEFNSLMDEELATSIGLTEEFTKAQEEANKMTAEGKDIYSTVGTYRQNYFIALLNNIATAIEAIEGMSGAVGYSMQENETAMEAFSKKWNQLIVSTKELAIQFGEAGFLDLMKDAVEASSAVLQLTKSIGGLKTILIALTAVFLSIKKEKIKSKLSGLVPVIQTLTGVTKLYEMALLDGATRMQAFGVAAQSVLGALGGWVTIAGVAVTAISAIANAQKQATEEARIAREETIEQGKESVKSFSQIGTAYQKYLSAQKSGNSDESIANRNAILQLLGYEIEDVGMLTNMYGDEKNAIQELVKEKYELMKLDAEEAYQTAISAEKQKEISKTRVEASQADREYIEQLIKSGKDYGYILDDLNHKLEQSQLGLDLGGTNVDITPNIDLSNMSEIDKAIEKLNQDLTNYKSVMSVANQKTSTLYQTTETARNILTQYKKEVEELKNQYELSQLSLEEYTQKLLELQTETENSLSSNEALNSALEEIQGTIDSLNKKMDDFQSSVKSVQDIISQYNETGIMTADMLQTLIGLAPEYIDLIDINSASLSLNQEKLENLMQVNDNYMVQMVAMKVAKEYEALATELQSEKYDNLTAAEITNMIATNNLGGVVYQLAMQLYSGQINAEQFKKGIQQAGEKAGLAASKVEVLTGSMTDLATSMGGVIKLAGMFPNLSFNAKMTINGKTLQQYQEELDKGIISTRKFQSILTRFNKGDVDTVEPVSTQSSGTNVWFPPTSTKSGGGGGSKSASDKYKEEKDALNELLEVYEHSIFLIEKNEKDSAKAGTEIAAIYKKMQDEVHAQAERYRAAGLSNTSDEIRELQKLWWDYQDKIEEVLHGIYEETVASHERAINVLEHQYDSAEQRLDYSYMGENLQKQLDYQIKIQRAAERELERLAKLGMDANSEAAQDVINTWYDAESAIRDISKKIQDSILQPYDDFIDLADKFDIWEYMDFTKVDYLRMKLAEINKLLAQGTMSIKEYNAALKEISFAMFDAQKDLFEKQKNDVTKNKDKIVAAYKSQISSLQAQKDQVSDYYDSVIDGYNEEIKEWEKRKEKVEDYYDTLIDNLNEVQEQNERINAQVDYYNERQKILTNLEQAEARSGVEWREKEMEYQQSLIDLDEDWKRTQDEWSIQDQIDDLNKLKEQALADIDLSIQAIRDTIEEAEKAKEAAIESIEAEIEGIESAITATEEAAEEEIASIDEQFQELCKTIAEAIMNGTSDGIVNSQAEIDQALVDGTNAMLNFIDSTSQSFTESSQETANNVYGIYDSSFVKPMYSEIDSIATYMQSSIPQGAATAATSALQQFRSSLIAPLKSEIASLMSQAQQAKSKLTEYQKQMFNAGYGPVAATPKTTSIKDTITQPRYIWDDKQTTANVYITNYNKSTETAQRRSQSQVLQAILSQR